MLKKTPKFFFTFIQICEEIDFNHGHHDYTVSQKKLCHCYFLNNSVKHWPILIIFGTQHQEET